MRFESAFFSNPEGRSFNCFIPMPFRGKAVVEVENQSPIDCNSLFFDINYTIGDQLPEELGLLSCLLAPPESYSTQRGFRDPAPHKRQRTFPGL